MDNVVGSYQFGVRNTKIRVAQAIDQYREELLNSAKKYEGSADFKDKAASEFLQEMEFLLREIKKDIEDLQV
jgi:hypothetical protein